MPCSGSDHAIIDIEAVRDILSTLQKWHQEGRTFAVARVLSTWGSAPRGAGSTMLISDITEVVGSVSGGCIEGSVIEAAHEVLATGRSRVLTFGVDDEKAWSVGLSCGGRIRVRVDPWSGFVNSGCSGELFSAGPFVLVTSQNTEEAGHLLMRADGSTLGTGIAPTEELASLASTALSERRSQEVEIGGVGMFLHAFPRPRRLVIIGGADITVQLLALAKPLAFETIVVDPRAVFTSRERFVVVPDHIHTAWPQEVLQSLTLDERTYVVLLTHDPKIDDPALHMLLREPVAYIGALGGRRTQEKRNVRLLEAGFTVEEVRRIHGPVGIDIGADSPAEIAVSILAQIIAVKNGVGFA